MYNAIVISGPTAVGKTALSIELAKKLNAVIISADAMQVYKHMDIGTSKVTKVEMQGVPHYMLDVVNPDEDFDLGMYYEMVNEILKKERKIPILTGGTGLYIAAITKGLTAMPKIDKKYREELMSKNIEDLLAILEGKVDFSTFDVNNKVRIIRKIETYGIEYNNIKGNNLNFLHIFLERERQSLYDRINKRVDIMIKEGLLEEAKFIYDNYDINRIRAIGYKELFSYFKGEITLEKAIEEIKKNSRRYAKRQFTWFRNKDEYIKYNLDEQNEENIIQKILEKFREG
ncbi:tRNA (adenosine(37)-N6)-dimethylallyltransferase MiaA [Caviibacter abscessus]|nr:tRNA (adenosine(37)-N6)-dimethylallyltransferase MiaA [Caviibacter abscessus]